MHKETGNCKCASPAQQGAGRRSAATVLYGSSPLNCTASRSQRSTISMIRAGCSLTNSPTHITGCVACAARTAPIMAAASSGVTRRRERAKLKPSMSAPAATAARACSVARIVIFESARRLFTGAQVENLGFGIAVIAFSVVVNLAVSEYLGRRARQSNSPALEGDATHLRTDAATSAGVVVGLAVVELTGAQWLDPVIALAVACAIILAGVRLLTRSGRVLVDEALPADELEAVREAIGGFGPRGVAGYHALRARRAGARRHVDLHVQFRSGVTLESAHEIAHALQAAIEERLGAADVLIHLEPEDRVRPGTEVPQR